MLKLENIKVVLKLKYLITTLFVEAINYIYVLRLIKE